MAATSTGRICILEPKQLRRPRMRTKTRTRTKARRRREEEDDDFDRIPKTFIIFHRSL